MAPSVDVAAPPTGGTGLPHAHVVPPAPAKTALQSTQHIDSSDSDDTIFTVDELLRRRARVFPNLHIVSYPSAGVDYVDYTFQQLDVFAYRVAKDIQQYVPSRNTSAQKRIVVAMLGPSNLEYLISLLALIKLGHTVLLLSTRISEQAIESLIKTTRASFLMVDSRYLETSTHVQGRCPGLQILEIPSRGAFEFPIEAVADTRLDAALDARVETEEIVYIIHSSGSTGLPKPIYQKQSAALANYAISMDMKALITLPLYHNHGICNFFRAIWSRKSIHLYNAALPLKCEHLITVLRMHNFEIFYGVPYALKLLAESSEGLDLLGALKVVMYGGSACPDDLGNQLVNHGVNLISHYGATEVGQLMTSFRPAGDKAWNYVRETEKLTPYLRWISRGPNIFECTVLPGWPAKVATNMEDGSYRTKDLFEPHPTIPLAWKYIARLDDTIVLVNGEKFNPVVTEGKIRANKLVTEAVIFGAQQPFLGVLIIPSSATEGKPASDVLDLIWPVIDAAQQSNDAFARLSKQMVVILEHGIDYPTTDKGSVIRQAFYKAFAKDIEASYDRALMSSEDAKDMSEAELLDFLRKLVRQTVPSSTLRQDDDTDFFSLGLDSLQSIQMRAEIVKAVRTRIKLAQNVVFDYPSVRKLAAHLLRNGDIECSNFSREDEMKSLVEKYSDFSSPIRSLESKTFVVVTGATGSLGAHIVAKLVRDDSIDRVFCFVRADDTESATHRTVESLMLRKVWHDLQLRARAKIVSLPADLSCLDLGLPSSTYQEIGSSLKAVIHAAWSVNFNLALSSLESQIAGVRNLISLCKTAGDGASFNFCSSVSAVARYPRSLGSVPECKPEPQWAQGMGYAQSKSVAEALCARAATKARVPVRVLRLGQLVADTAHGVWNATEAIPLMMQSARTIGALPRLPETPSWISVDVAAAGVTEVALSPSTQAEENAVFANVTNHRTFSWTEDLLPALHEAGLAFEEVTPREWVRRLRASNPDPVANPPIKLVDFFASKYDREESEFKSSLEYDTAVARSLSPALANAPLLDHAFVKRFCDYFLAGPWKVKSYSPASTYTTKKVVIASGPCGSGKTTLATALAAELDVPYVEGDSLHSREAIDDMRAGKPLTDSQRWSWLERVNRRVEEQIYELGYEAVVLSCSGLRRAYRDKLRQVGQGKDGEVELVFLDLQCEAEALRERVKARRGHYMKEEMVHSQLTTLEPISVEETDVYPLDAGKQVDKIVEEAVWVVRRSGSVKWMGK